MKTSLSIIQMKTHDDMRAWKILRLKGIIPDRLGYNSKSVSPFCTTSLSYLFQKVFYQKLMQLIRHFPLITIFGFTTHYNLT